jgi:F0F1-type ATP synthase assembly protein I
VRFQLLLRSKPVRTVLRWQSIVTVGIALVAWPFAGAGGAGSALFGGLINLVAGVAYFAVAGAGRFDSAGATVHRALRAEACKVLVTVAALCTVLSSVKGIEFMPFLASFILTALLPSLALLVPDDDTSHSALLSK